MGYTVKPGDSWAKIAGKIYGDQRMLGELQRANKGIGSLRPGMRISTPKKRSNPLVTASELSNEVSATKDASGAKQSLHVNPYTAQGAAIAKGLAEQAEFQSVIAEQKRITRQQKQQDVVLATTGYEAAKPGPAITQGEPLVTRYDRSTGAVRMERAGDVSPVAAAAEKKRYEMMMKYAGGRTADSKSIVASAMESVQNTYTLSLGTTDNRFGLATGQIDPRNLKWATDPNTGTSYAVKDDTVAQRIKEDGVTAQELQDLVAHGELFANITEEEALAAHPEARPDAGLTDPVAAAFMEVEARDEAMNRLNLNPPTFPFRGVSPIESSLSQADALAQIAEGGGEDGLFTVGEGGVAEFLDSSMGGGLGDLRPGEMNLFDYIKYKGSSLIQEARYNLQTQTLESQIASRAIEKQIDTPFISAVDEMMQRTDIAGMSDTERNEELGFWQARVWEVLQLGYKTDAELAEALEQRGGRASLERATQVVLPGGEADGDEFAPITFDYISNPDVGFEDPYDAYIKTLLYEDDKYRTTVQSIDAKFGTELYDPPASFDVRGGHKPYEARLADAARWTAKDWYYVQLFVAMEKEEPGSYARDVTGVALPGQEGSHSGAMGVSQIEDIMLLDMSKTVMTEVMHTIKAREGDPPYKDPVTGEIDWDRFMDDWGYVQLGDDWMHRIDPVTYTGGGGYGYYDQGGSGYGGGGSYAKRNNANSYANSTRINPWNWRIRIT